MCEANKQQEMHLYLARPMQRLAARVHAYSCIRYRSVHDHDRLCGNSIG